MLDRTLAPAHGRLIAPELTQSQSIVLSNALPVYYIEGQDSGVIKLEVMVRSGAWFESQPGISWFTAHMLREGTNQYSSFKLAEQFENLGAFLEVNPGFDHVSIVLYCMKQQAHKTIQLFHHMLTAPAFPEQELNTLKNIRGSQIELGLAKNSFLASRLIRKLLFGLQHPYGQSMEVTDIDPITNQHLKDFYNSHFLDEMQLFVSGDVGDEELALLENIFSGIERKESRNTQASDPQKTHKEFRNKEGSLQSSIRMGLEIPDKSHDDHYKILITNEILGGYFGSRLMRNLREDKGYTYGAQSRPLFLQEASFVIISTDVVAQHTDEAIDQIRAELTSLCEDITSTEELETVKNYMAGTFLSSVSTPFELMEKFKAIHLHGLDYTYYHQYFAHLADIQPQDVLETAQRYFHPKMLFEATVGLRKG